MVPESIYMVKAAACIAAGVCMGIGGLGPALGQGFIGGKACESLGKKPEAASAIKGTMMIAMIIVETSGIFAFLISLILLFVVS
jgi:F-type H+-transporting ATPase subunit c